jgi:hypothetical protein
MANNNVTKFFKKLGHTLWINRKNVLNPTFYLQNNIRELGKQYLNNERISRSDVFIAMWTTMFGPFIAWNLILAVLDGLIIISNALQHKYIWRYTSVINMPFTVGVVFLCIGTILILVTNKHAYYRFNKQITDYLDEKHKIKIVSDEKQNIESDHPKNSQ